MRVSAASQKLLTCFSFLLADEAPPTRRSASAGHHSAVSLAVSSTKLFYKSAGVYDRLE
jgi:hypothetical protein